MTDHQDLGLLLLHALPLDSSMWAEQMSILLGRTCAPNLYAFGDNIEDWAKQSLALTQAKRLIVVGCSVGGSCALEVAIQAPHRVAALVLIGTKARHDPDPAFYRQSLDFVQKQGVEAAWQTYWEPLFSDPEDKKVAPKAKDIALRQTRKYLANGLSAFHSRPSREKFVAETDLPIHVVTGEHDTKPGLTYSRKLATSAKQGYLHVIKSSGHYVPMVQATELNRLLSGIVRTHTATLFGG